MLARMASEIPAFDTIPNLADMFCNSTVVSTEKTKAQRNEKPKFAPARLAVVTVPGPTKAAVTINPGPNLSLLDFNDGVPYHLGDLIRDGFQSFRVIALYSRRVYVSGGNKGRVLMC